MKWIKCLKCGMVSYNQNDVEYHYCGNCHLFLKPDEFELGDTTDES